jgi:hypothetical protein
MIHLQKSIIVHRPVEEVFDFIINPEHHKEPGKYADYFPQPVGPVPEWWFHRNALITQYDLNQQITKQITEYGCNPAIACTSYSLKSTEEGSVVTVVTWMEGKGLFKLIYQLQEYRIMPYLTSVVDSSLSQLKTRLESHPLNSLFRISGPLPALDEGQLPPEMPQ